MSKPTRVVVPIDSHDPSAWAHAVTYATAIGSRAQPAAQDYVLLTHTKQQLKYTSLAGHIGQTISKKLLANTAVPMQSGGQLRHATLQTLRGSRRGAVIVAYFADEGMLQTLDGIDGIIGIVAVPELAGEIDGWIVRWNPIACHHEPARQGPHRRDASHSSRERPCARA